ncbi:nitroreductase family protein [Proteocatella sphenisci]|uniref:nitroreductase family protein n=1 Tax=Proteocatella sphenisci TaxID=181070 RepID=UPI00048A9CA6|nr:nitroreductase family protein [Proteocatella sphenisci]
MEFMNALKNRRSHYDIGRAVKISEDKITEIVKEAVKHTPSAFNSQSARIVVLFGKHHDRLWDITMEKLRKVVAPEKFEPTEVKINSFKAGFGTVLFFDDSTTTDGLKAKFPLYSENFGIWAQQANGMVQHSVWVALGQEGLGASLQHYNELIEDAVKQEWTLDKGWKLSAQMPFGNIVSHPGDKEFMDLEERVFVFEK